mmetsp:Transcript_4032/g.8555  ORF Transcript_4032/g.8555 Transcript_4032/m.8555 type:complete len:104 (+) Transcript_4032:914-1225(+)
MRRVHSPFAIEEGRERSGGTSGDPGGREGGADGGETMISPDDLTLLSLSGSLGGGDASFRWGAEANGKVLLLGGTLKPPAILQYDLAIGEEANESFSLKGVKG